MNVPTRYKIVRGALPDEVSFGCGGINLVPLGEIESGQLGYSVAKDGTSLCTGALGAWQPSWLVIGYEVAMGDPIFIDSGDTKLSVFIAMHGEGAWEPNLIASSLDSFARCLRSSRKLRQAGGTRLSAMPIQSALMNASGSWIASRSTMEVPKRRSFGMCCWNFDCGINH